MTREGVIGKNCFHHFLAISDPYHLGIKTYNTKYIRMYTAVALNLNHLFLTPANFLVQLVSFTDKYSF